MRSVGWIVRRLSLRRASAATVVSALVLVPALVLSGPLAQSAQAVDTTEIKVAASIATKVLPGAARALAPVVLAPVTPWGLAIDTALVAGTVLYSTRDSWLPYVRGALGDEGTRIGPGVDPPYCQASMDWDVAPSASLTGQSLRVKINNSVCGNAIVQAGYTITCRTPAGNYSSGSGENGAQLTGSSNGPVYMSAGSCLAGDHVTAVRVYPCCTGNQYLDNSLEWSIATTPAEATNKTVLSCKLSDGTTQTATLTSTADQGIPMPSCETRWGAGATAVSGDVYSGAGPNPTQRVGGFTTTAPPAAYPNCTITARCVLDVLVDGSVCAVARSVCADWATLYTTAPSRVTCKWGAYVVPIAQCGVLERAYEVDGGQNVTSSVDTDGLPGTATPKPAVSTVPTATATTTVTSSPAPSTSSSPAAAPLPTTGTNPVPDPAPSTVDPDTTNCLGSGWSWNPVSWVYVPVRCSWLWARDKVLVPLLIPSPGTVAQVEGVGATIGNKVPFSYVGDAATWVQTATDVSGHCVKYGVTLAQFGRVGLLDTCTPGPIEGILMGYRTLLGVVVFLSFFGPLAWWAWRTYAPGTTASA